MNEESDFYKILGINKNATHDEIRKSYKKLVLKFHPDKNPTDEAPIIFRKIQTAYETLSDPEKRRKYDQFDGIDNSNEIKYIFMRYQELVNELCEKYQISDDDKEQIYNLFDLNDYQDEIHNNNINAAYQKLYTKIWSKSSEIIAKNHPYISNIVNFFCKWLI